MKRLTALATLLLACGGTPPAPPEAPAKAPAAEPAPAPIPVVRLESDALIAEIRLVFRAGSAYDPTGKEGLGELMATAIAEGGTESLTYPQLLDALHPWAASIGAQVDKEQLTFYARCHQDHLEAFYPIFRDVLLKPRLGADDFERVKKQALTTLTQEIRTTNDEELSKLVLEAAIFDGHPYAHPVVGTEAGLTAIGLDDVKAHRAAVLTRARLTIGVAGAAHKVLDRLQADLAALPAGQAVAKLPPPKPNARRLVVVEQPTAKSTAISIGHALPVRRGDADFPALALMASHFGEHRQFQGVLFQSIREQRGMNYGDYAYVEAFLQEGWGRFPRTNVARSNQHFSVWIRPVPSEDRHFALRIAMWNLRKLLADGIPAAAFEETRGFLDGYLYLHQQTEMRRLGYALDDRFYGLARPYGEWVRAGFAALDADKLNAAVKKHIHPDDVTVVVVTADAQAFVDAVLAEQESPKSYASPKPEKVTKEDAEIAKLKLGFTKEGVTVLNAAELFAK